jgi:peptidoglycan hydrolase CwlO-like protein
MTKYKILLAFGIGFIVATGISIYKQERVAGKANKQIATANNVISGMQDKQKELQELKRQINDELLRSNFLQNKVNQLQNELANYECPIQQNLSQNFNGVYILPSEFEMTISRLTYNCRQKK